jgi:hypothetical protein
MTFSGLSPADVEPADSQRPAGTGATKNAPMTNPTSVQRYRAMPERELRDLPTPTWLFEPLHQGGGPGVHRGGLNLAVAPRGGHKTHFLAGLGVAAATRGRYLSTQATQGGAVFAIVAEDAPGWHQRWFDSRRAAGIDDARDLPLFTWTAPVNLFTGALFDDLMVEVERINPMLILLDPLSDCMVGADENSARDAGVVRERLRHLASDGRTVIVAHHAGHSHRGRARGSSAWEAASDSVLTLASCGLNVTLTCARSKNSSPFAPMHLRFDPEARVLRLEGEERSAPAPESRAPEATTTTSIRSRLIEVLADGPMPLATVVEVVGASVPTIERTVRRYPRQFQRRIDEGVVWLELMDADSPD